MTRRSKTMQTSSRSASKQIRTIETSVRAERSSRKKEISAQNSNQEDWRASESPMQGDIKRKKASAAASPDPQQVPTKMSQKNIQDWRRILQIFKEYKKKYSTCMIPSRYNFGGVKLGRWVCRQRCQAREGKLNPEQWETLDSMGFIWDLKTPQAESEQALMPDSLVPPAQKARVRVVSPDTSANTRSYLNSFKNVKGALEKGSRRKERKKKKARKSIYRSPGQIVNYATMNVAINKPLEEKREESDSKMLSNTTKVGGMVDDGSESRSGSEAAVEPATRKSSRKRALPQKFVDNILFTEDQDLSDLETGFYEEDTEEYKEDDSSYGDSTQHQSTNDLEGVMLKDQHLAPAKQRNLWQDMYDHDHQWHNATAKEPNAYQERTLDDDGDQEEGPISWRYWPPLHDEYSTWQAVDTRETQWKKQNQKGAGWQEMHSQNKGWKDYYSKLVSFCLMHGHCDVPFEINNGDSSEPSLYAWVSAQRKLHRTKRLSAERTSLLKQIGFGWTASASDKVVGKKIANAAVACTREGTKATLPPPPIIAPFSPDIAGKPRRQYFSPEKYDQETL